MHAIQSASSASRYEILTLPSGLTVQIKPMPGFSTVHAMYSTRFGSIDRSFMLDGRRVELPEGSAHFLEHKMFESEDGDAFSKYAKTGANANAYTSFDRTCYLFSATSKVAESLDVLLGMVGEPYFTKETIEKEQGIIGQEIKMYDDSPDWRLLTESFRSLYEAHPIRADIAGTTESIAAITPEMLYDACAAFYSPQNMVLSVAGRITREEVLAACERAGLMEPAPAHAVERLFPAEGERIRRPEHSFSMPVALPCFCAAWRETPILGVDVKAELIGNMVPDLVCGSMTPLYRRLYDQGLVNPGFEGEFLAVQGAASLLFSGESRDPQRVLGMLSEEIERLRREGVDPELFRLVKNELYGEMIGGLESVENTCSEMNSAALRGYRMQDEVEALSALTAQDFDEAFASMLLPQNRATVIITPETGAEKA